MGNDMTGRINIAGYPEVCLRRYRKTAAIRALTGMPVPPIQQFIWPTFLKAGKNIKEETQLPDQYFLSIDRLLKEVEPLVKQGIGGVLLFSKIDQDLKDINGKYAWNPSGLVQKGIRALKKEFPDLTVFTDIGLTAYTTHGHNGILDKSTGQIDNDLTLPVLAKIAVSHAQAGADGVGPSGMIDGQIKVIRGALDSKALSNTIIMSYAVKFMSDLYKAFPSTEWDMRQESPLTPTCFADMSNLNLALREAILDEQEGADILMIKPGLFYLDVIAEIRRNHLLPIAAYNVSGEYCMIHATDKMGWGDKYLLAYESLMAIRRAGADIIISYWANQYDKIFNQTKKQ